MDISNKTVLVVGTGKSGVAAAKLLLHHAKKVYIQDGNEALDVAAFRSKNPELTPVELILGDVSEDMLKSFDIAVLSPGVPLDIPLVEKMKTLGMTIWGEIELAYVLGKGHVVAITGTNGKTTTTTLVGQIMARHFAHVAVVGNIGIPYTSVAEECPGLHRPRQRRRQTIRLLWQRSAVSSWRPLIRLHRKRPRS